MRLPRLRALFAAGLTDSFGLALGWTVFVLYAAETGGLGIAGALSAAMLAGVALSAPATTLVAARFDGAALLRMSTLAEMVLRPASFGLLLTGAPTPLLAVCVCLAHLAGWTSYAGMRAEVAAVDPRPATMTAYVVAVASVEALGAAAGALLPAGPSASGLLLAVVAVVYAGGLVPTLLVAAGSRVARSTCALAPALKLSAPALSAGLVITALAAGPTLLSAALAQDLHGRESVAIAAVAFTVGALLAPALAGGLERRGVSVSVAWPALGFGMVAGWVLAPLHVAGLVLAQVFAGMCLSAFEGTMDGRLAAGRAASGGASAVLAWAAAARALGGSAAVALLPLALAAGTLGTVSAWLAAVLAVGAAAGLALTGRAGVTPEPAPVARS